MDAFEDWIGKCETAVQTADLWPARGLAAVLNRPFAARIGDPVPPLAHWLYFTPAVPQSAIGSDGHPERGGFIPPIPQPRRMWAASNIEFLGPIHFGEEIEKTAEIVRISNKDGATGPLVFVEIRNSYRTGGAERLVETQTLVYRDPPGPGETPAAKPAPTDAEWSISVTTDPTRLFRYSAVTFNAHRIHFDHPYVTGEEGYPGVIVHGQFIATMLMDALLEFPPDRLPSRFTFRALKPILCRQIFFAEGRLSDDDSTLWARNETGDMCLTAKATFT